MRRIGRNGNEHSNYRTLSRSDSGKPENRPSWQNNGSRFELSPRAIEIIPVVVTPWYSLPMSDVLSAFNDRAFELVKLPTFISYAFTIAKRNR